MTRNMNCSIPCPQGKCRACDLERAGQTPPKVEGTLGAKYIATVHERPTVDLTFDDLGALASAGGKLAVEYIPDPDEEDFERVERVLGASKPKVKIDPGPRRYGANYTPPKDDGLLVFMSYLPVGADGSETCANCGKHVSRHYGGTQYRCFAVPEGHPDFKGDQSAVLVGQALKYKQWSEKTDVDPEMVQKFMRDTECQEENRLNFPRSQVEPGYELLAAILDEALEQAQAGKGKERHSAGEPFHEQPITQISFLLGSSDFNLGQAVKKLRESKRLPPARRRAERLGAINYIVASIIVDEDLDEQAERKKG